MTDAADNAVSILRQQEIASLGTLHRGEPFVSMVPFAWIDDGSGLVIHVSALSAHTRDMLELPRVSLLVIAKAAEAVSPQATPRVTIQGDAKQLERSSGEYAAARKSYLSRFPDSEGMFELGDFSLFLISPTSARVIGGFGRASTISAADLAASLRGA